MTAQPAFTTVIARHSLAKAAAPPVPASKGTEYTPGMVEYVQRAFFEYNLLKDDPSVGSITDGEHRDRLASILKDAPNHVDRDWSTYPLPHEFLLGERQQAALHVAQDAILANINNNQSPLPRHNDLVPPGPNTKKRKSSDQGEMDSEDRRVTPPWKQANIHQKSLADRITGTSKKQDKKRNKDNGKASGWFAIDSSEEALARRQKRFGGALSPDVSSPLPSSRDDSPSVVNSAGPIVGTCETLEKQYFRLTAPPNPNTVRPLPILEKALHHVIQKWKESKNYTYVCDQLKSIRQDLTVQRLKNKFTVRVYEVHARIALEKKDLGEYNQCQTQLRALYKLRLGDENGSGGNEDEFTAYRILYLVYTRNRTDMNNMLADLTPADKKGPFVQHALKVRSALAAGNYHRFFKLYNDAYDWNMVPFLMDMFIERERLRAMAVMSKAYKPDVGCKFLTQELGFAVDCDDSIFEVDQIRGCLEFICRYGGGSLLQEKDDDIRMLVGKAGNLFESAKQSAFSLVDIKGQI